MPRLVSHLLRHPLLHFAVVGALLVVAQRTWVRTRAGDPPEPDRRIVISADRIRSLRAEFERRWGGPPTAVQLRTSIARAVEEEMLVREARVLALDHRDASVRRRLIEKARAVNRRPQATAEDLHRQALALGLENDAVIHRLLAEKMRLFLEAGDPAPIEDAELRAYLEENRARFLQPETISFTHVFLSRSVHRDRLAADAAAMRDALEGIPPSAEIARRSDPFPLGSELRAQTREQLMARFGKSFADQLLALVPGRWSAPIASPYGMHVIWVSDHRPARLPALEEVRAAIEVDVSQRRAAANLAQGMERLRQLYEVRIEDGGLDVAVESSRPGGPAS